MHITEQTARKRADQTSIATRKSLPPSWSEPTSPSLWAVQKYMVK